jgi:hypothetical protein
VIYLRVYKELEVDISDTQLEVIIQPIAVTIHIVDGIS